MEDNVKEPYFELKNAAGVTKYVIYWLAEYSKDPRKEPLVYGKLKIVFSVDSRYQIKVLDGNVFGSVFIQRLGKKRLEKLKYHLEKIDKERYGIVEWEYCIKQAKNKRRRGN